MKNVFRSALLLAASAAFTSPAIAAFTFSNGELILGFQATSGTGSSQNVFFNLGSPIAYRDGTNPTGTIGNISTTLSTVYGANWYDRTDLYFGIVGNLNGQPNLPAIGGRGTVDGDASRTFYLSLAAATPGSGSLYAPGTYASSQLGTAGTILGGMETMLPGLTTEADGAAILSQVSQPTEWENGWTNRMTFGNALTIFSGSLQQNFGELGDSTYVDLQRVVSTNSGSTLPVPGVIGGGQYITSFSIGRDGSISAIPEPSTALLCGLGVLALLRRRRA